MNIRGAQISCGPHDHDHDQDRDRAVRLKSVSEVALKLGIGWHYLSLIFCNYRRESRLCAIDRRHRCSCMTRHPMREIPLQNEFEEAGPVRQSVRREWCIHEFTAFY